MRANHIFPFLWMRGEEEAVVREEMAIIDECGIKAVCVEARPHDDYCGPKWWHDLDIVIDEAEKRGMRVWILDDKHFPTGYANGLIETQYQEKKKHYINFNTVDIFGSSKLMSIPVQRMLKPKMSVFDIGKPCDEAERAKNILMAVVACRMVQGNVLEEDTVDLTDQVKDGEVTVQLPEGQWRVYVIYRTRTDGGDSNYINMLDRESAALQIEGVYEPHYQHYKDKFGKVIAGFFSDEPQFGNVGGFAKDAKIGTEMPLLWSSDVEQELRSRLGADMRRLLPFLWSDTEQMDLCPTVRFDYMDIATRLYAEYFSKHIGDWCRGHGIEYIGHVVEDDGCHARCGMGAGHYFRAMFGQDMAGIDDIGAQVVFGAPDAQRRQFSVCDGEFYHFTLGKLGASCGHLDPRKKGRTMCELFGAYGWEFGVRDQKYVLEHLLAKGVNELVPHAFSMAEYPDPDCPPHFYARGNNPQYPYFKDLMHYANVMCDLLSDGRHVASVALLYDAELEWVGNRMPMQKVARQLIEHQVEFDIVSIDMLYGEYGYEPNVDGNRLEISGVEFGVLVVPWAERIPERLAAWIINHSKFPILFIDAVPQEVVGKSGVFAAADSARALSECPQLHAVKLDNLMKSLSSLGLYEEFLEPACSDVSLYRYRKQGGDVFMLLNESAYQVYEGTLCVKDADRFSVFDARQGVYYTPASHAGIVKGGEISSNHIPLHLEPGESLVLMSAKPGMPVLEDCAAIAKRSPVLSAVDLSLNWLVAAATAKQYPQFCNEDAVDALEPYSFAHPSFAGVIRYRRQFVLAKEMSCAVLTMEHVQELASVWIDGEFMGSIIQPPYHLALPEGIAAGEHELVIEVTTTADRDQRNYPHPPFDLYFSASEATGLYGAVKLEEKEQ